MGIWKKILLSTFVGGISISVGYFSSLSCRKHFQYCDRVNKARTLVEQIADKNTNGRFEENEQLCWRREVGASENLRETPGLKYYERYLENRGLKLDPRCGEYLRIRDYVEK